MNGNAFLDASFWIAYRDERQEMHDKAKCIFSDAFRARIMMVTTLPVLCEIQAHFSRNLAKKNLILADFWNNPLIRIEDTTHQDQADAFQLLSQHADKTYSLCDALTFSVMRRIGLKRVLAIDDHFRQFGEFQIIS